MEVVRIRKFKNVKMKKALFPGYLFCRFDPESRMEPIVRWSRGVAYFLGTVDGFTRLPDELIAHLRERVASWNSGGYKTRFHPGDPVIVQEGPLAGFEGIFRRHLPARQRCEVLGGVVVGPLLPPRRAPLSEDSLWVRRSELDFG